LPLQLAGISHKLKEAIFLPTAFGIASELTCLPDLPRLSVSPDFICRQPPKFLSGVYNVKTALK
jgi:hypothetical protein